MEFDAKKVKEELVLWIKNWFKENGDGCKGVLGISGGKDSSVTAALLVEALGKENVVGVMMPNGEQFDIDVSIALAKHLGIKAVTVNIKDSFSGLVSQLENSGIELSRQAEINLAPRLRMAAVYAVSQSFATITMAEFLQRNGGTLKWEQARPLFLPFAAFLMGF